MLGEVGIKAKPKEGEPAKLDKGSKVQYQGVNQGMLGPQVRSDTFTVGEDTRSRKERTSKNPKADKWYDYRHPDADMTIADIPDEDQELLRKQLNLDSMGSSDQDVELSQSMYNAWLKAGKKPTTDKFRDEFKSQKEYDAYNPYSQAGDDWGFSGSLHAGLIPRNPEKNKIPQRKELVKTGSKFAAKAKQKAIDERKLKQPNLITKDKEAERDIQVPETVSGPKGRTKSKKKLAFDYKDSLAAKLNMPFKQERVKDWKDTDLVERITGLDKPGWNRSRRGVVTQTTTKVKNARLSERMKYKKEEKLAGARERVLGMSGVALKDQANKYGTAVKRGEKLQEGSAQRLKDLKALYDSDSMTYKDDKGVERKTGAIKGEKLTGNLSSSSGERVSSLKGAKADIKEIGKLSKGQVKGIRTEGSAKGRAIAKSKSMMAEAKAAKAPKKFSKDTSAAGLAKDLEAMKSAKSPAEIKAMKSSARTAMKEARGMKRTAEEKKMIRTGVKGTRGVAKEARSFKGDIRKGLRMEKKDTRAINVAATASEAKKARKTAKGKTMRGTSYFSMTELNKTIPLKGAADVAKYKEPKLMTKSDIKEYAKSGKNVKLGKILEAGKNIKTGARQYSSSQGNMQAGARRFSKK
jgi:hypothetical protein